MSHILSPPNNIELGVLFDRLESCLDPVEDSVTTEFLTSTGHDAEVRELPGFRSLSPRIANAISASVKYRPEVV